MNLLAIVFGTLISEDSTLILSMIAQSQGKVSYWTVFIGNVLGITLGDLAYYGIGRSLRAHSHRWDWLVRRMNPEKLHQGKLLFDRWGFLSIPITRFMPAIRAGVYTVIGFIHGSFLKFAMTLFITTLVWVPASMGLLKWMKVSEWNKRDIIISILLVTAVPFLIERLRRYQKKKILSRMSTEL